MWKTDYTDIVVACRFLKTYKNAIEWYSYIQNPLRAMFDDSNTHFVYFFQQYMDRQTDK